MIDSTGAIERRYVRGDGADELIFQLVGSIDRWYYSDERGSVVTQTDDAGNAQITNRYDEYGLPQSTNSGYYQYTGQMWLNEIGVYNYKARAYSPTAGRFLQTDPIGPVDSPNLYQYALNDPANIIDPLGLDIDCDGHGATVCGTRVHFENFAALMSGAANVFSRLTQLRMPSDSDGGNGNSGDPGQATSQSEAKTCPSTTSTAAQIANLADKISLGAGSVAVTAGIAGLATAPTGAGLVGFEGVALVAGAVSTGASIVGTVAHAANSDIPGALMDAGGVIGGSVAGRLAARRMASSRMFGNLSASQERTVKLVANASGTTIGAGSSLLYRCN